MSKKRVAVTLRKPQASADVESFVLSESPAVAPPAAAGVPQASWADESITLGARRYRELTLYLPSELVQSLSRYCLEQNLDLNRVIAQAAQKHIAAGEPSAQVVTWQILLDALLREYGSKLSAFFARRSQRAL